MNAEIGLPQKTVDLYGHEAAERTFLDAYRSGRLHHAWLITGPAGIGKATFAFRAARYLFDHPDPDDPGQALDTDLSVDPGSTAAAQVKAGSHPNLLHVQRPWDEKNKRLRTAITVDEIRRTIGFFGTTAARPGWRVCVIDSADELNLSAANALLKNLEEPTNRSLYLIVCHNPGRLLPTIRSRCRTLPLKPLGPQELRKAVGAIVALNDITVAEDDLEVAVEIGRGSVGKALTVLVSGGAEIAHDFRALVADLPDLDRTRLHALANRLAQRDSDAKFSLLCDLALEYATDRIRDPGPGLAAKALWVEAGTAVNALAADAGIYNLDRKQTVIAVIEALARAARPSLSHTHQTG